MFRSFFLPSYGEGCRFTSVAPVSLPVTKEGSPTSEGNGELVGPVKLKFSGCPFELTCTFGGSKIKLIAEGSETEPKIVAKAVELPLIEGGKLCPTSEKWTATYIITSATEDYTYSAEGGSINFEFAIPTDGFVEAKSE